jgi:alpha-L-rhamnosidase
VQQRLPKPKVQNTLTEHLVNPIAIGTTGPRFSWQLASEKRTMVQIAYEIRVGSDVSFSAIQTKIWLELR